MYVMVGRVEFLPRIVSPAGCPPVEGWDRHDAH